MRCRLFGVVRRLLTMALCLALFATARSMIEFNSSREAIAIRARRGELGPSAQVVLFIVAVVVVSVHQLWSSELQFDAVGLSELTEPRSEVKALISLPMFALIRYLPRCLASVDLSWLASSFCRMLFAVVGVATIVSVITGSPLTITTIYDRDSKIRGPVVITFSGIDRLATFTVQTFTMQTGYHVVTALLTALAAWAPALVPALPRFFMIATWVAYQVSATCSLLVTVIVTFVLIPGILKKGGDPKVMFLWPGQVMHNCNLLFMVTELLINRLHFVPAHFAFAVFYGMWYVFFSWCFLR